MVRCGLLLGALALAGPASCRSVEGEHSQLAVREPSLAATTNTLEHAVVEDMATEPVVSETTWDSLDERAEEVELDSPSLPDDHEGIEYEVVDEAGTVEPRAAAGLVGVSYSPYRKDGNCKTQADVNADFNRLKGKYGLIRSYGTDCGQVPIIKKAAKMIGAKVMYGVFDINQVGPETALLIKGIAGDWAHVHSVSVGNELVNSGQASTAQVQGAVAAVRKKLRAAGFKGAVVAVDTFIATKSNPVLCECSDFCAINAHAYFDPTMTAGQAGAWLQREVKAVKAALSRNMRVVVTETGWPTKGNTNGLAVPSLANQKKAIQSIRTAFKGQLADVILFSAFDDLWKSEVNDHYWGIDGAVSAS